MMNGGDAMLACSPLILARRNFLRDWQCCVQLFLLHRKQRLNLRSLGFSVFCRYFAKVFNEFGGKYGIELILNVRFRNHWHLRRQVSMDFDGFFKIERRIEGRRFFEGVKFRFSSLIKRLIIRRLIIRKESSVEIISWPLSGITVAISRWGFVTTTRLISCPTRVPR